jgi:ElaB/YqjD/DUF883 family membrane-anchored ribosome-binding protein
MADQPEVIQQELDETRSALAEKLEIIGERISGTVENVTDSVESVTTAVENTVEAISDTVESVGESAQDTVAAVRHAFDIPAQVRQHPWLWLAGSVAAGFVAGKFLIPSGESRRREPQREHDSHYGRSYAGQAAGDFFSEHAHRDRHNGFSTPPAESSAEPSESKSWLTSLAERFGPEINKLKGLALGTLFGVTRDMIAQSLPQSLKTEVVTVIDDITETAGGHPIRGHVLDESSDADNPKGVNDGESNDTEMGRPVGAAQGQGQAGMGRSHRR